jgi:hypothetical protein
MLVSCFHTIIVLIQEWVHRNITEQINLYYSSPPNHRTIEMFMICNKERCEKTNENIKEQKTIIEN